MAKRYNDFEAVEEQMEILVVQDFRVIQFDPYHWRVNERISIWPTRRKYYDLKRKELGHYSDLIEFIHNRLGYQPLHEYYEQGTAKV